uniref:PlsC domain-containing protein n=1 Tax=Parastrongyloides trichosuri TaxID=131310 RepID=A0A0N4ZC44_PARTI
MYISLILKLQYFFSPIIDNSIEVDGKYTEIIKKDHDNILFNSIEKSLYDFDLITCDNGLETFALLSNKLYKTGIEAIIDDDLTRLCNQSPVKRWNLMGLPPKTKCKIKNIFLSFIALISLIIRYAIILPCRIFLLASSFIFIFFAAIIGSFNGLTRQQGTYVAVTVSRLYTASMGYVGLYRDRKYQPAGPGITVSNHLTANDVQILWSDVNYDERKGYSLTGQKHKGIIGLFEACSSKFLDTLWLERSNESERQNFQKNVLKAARDENFKSILLFPEGYCSNNTAVCQFKKSLFVDDVNIYPIAIKQDPRLGDAFWYEDDFLSYTFRLLTSWATIYHVHYLPSQIKRPSENEIEFAYRIQELIASAVSIKCIKNPSTELLKKEKARQKQLMLTRENFGCFIIEQWKKYEISKSNNSFEEESYSSRQSFKEPFQNDGFYNNIIATSTN